MSMTFPPNGRIDRVLSLAGSGNRSVVVGIGTRVKGREKIAGFATFESMIVSDSGEDLRSQYWQCDSWGSECSRDRLLCQ